MFEERKATAKNESDSQSPPIVNHMTHGIDKYRLTPSPEAKPIYPGEPKGSGSQTSGGTFASLQTNKDHRQKSI